MAAALLAAALLTRHANAVEPPRLADEDELDISKSV
jgi:hypothetical protein